MALDRNYIELTDFSILQPAIDYYPKHGTPDQRLKTRYYEGRIYANRGDDDAAMTAFLEAAENSNLVRDSLPLARLYMALGVMYSRQYDHQKYIDATLRAAEIHRKYGDRYHEAKCLIEAIGGAVLEEDTVLGDRLLKSFSPLLLEHLQDIEFMPSELLVAYMDLRSKEELRSLISTVDTIPDMTFETKLNLALAYSSLGEMDNAMASIPAQKEISNLQDSLKYFAVRT